MVWYFVSRTGLLQISDFDGQSFGGSISDPGLGGTHAVFAGSLAGSGLSGSVKGAFVSDGVDSAAGVIGNFGVSNGEGYTVTGTIAAERAENTFVPLRVLTAGEEYFTEDGQVIENPGERGLVGSTEETDQVTYLTVPAGGTIGTGQLIQGEFQLPVFLSESGYSEHSVTNAPTPFGPASGLAYANVGGFTAYALGINNDPTVPFYALAGAPSDVASVLEGTSIRTYAFTQDPIQQIPVPLFQTGLIDNFSNAAITPFYLVESPNIPDGPDARLFQAWLVINGTGPSQESAVGITASNINSTDPRFDGYAAIGGRRGSYRESGTSSSFHLFGGTATVQGPTGGDTFFGPNAESFVLSGDDTLGNSPSDQEVSGVPSISTAHVAHLTSETDKSNLTRTDRTLSGFSAGMLQGWAESGGPHAPTPTIGEIDVEFDVPSSRVGGEISAHDLSGTSGIAHLQVAFGSGIDGNSEGGGSAFVDDDIYAARQNSNFDATYALAQGETAELLPVATGNNPGTYFVSAESVPQSEFMAPGTEVCTCEFLEWGWWGTQVNLADSGAADPSVVTRQESVHLGTWAAGDIVDYSEMPTDGSATYSGHAIGSVAAGGAQYIAGGAMSLTWHFGPRNGELAVSNFDGHNFGGTVEAQSTTDAIWGGELSGGSLAGSAVGAFVRNGADPAGGVVGAFEVTGEGYAASGTLAGQPSFEESF
jgi:hypothetical protein